MQIGFCAKLDRIGEIAAAGYDYIEMPVTAAAAWTEEEFARNLEILRAAKLPAPAFNVLFPGERCFLLKRRTKQSPIICIPRFPVSR